MHCVLHCFHVSELGAMAISSFLSRLTGRFVLWDQLQLRRHAATGNCELSLVQPRISPEAWMMSVWTLTQGRSEVRWRAANSKFGLRVFDSESFRKQMCCIKKVLVILLWHFGSPRSHSSLPQWFGAPVVNWQPGNCAPLPFSLRPSTHQSIYCGLNRFEKQSLQYFEIICSFFALCPSTSSYVIEILAKIVCFWPHLQNTKSFLGASLISWIRTLAKT